MKYTALKQFCTGILLITVLSFFKCNDDGDPVKEVTIPEQLMVNKANFFPEDIFVYKNTVYVSGLGDGTIQKFDLTEKAPVAKEVVGTDKDNPSRWGLAVDEGRQTLLNIGNVAYAFDGKVSGPAKVFAYGLSNHSLKSSWTLPEGTVGNSIVVAHGFYYISDIGPNTRIIRLDPATGKTIIKTDSQLPSNGFGFGNLIYANNGLYGAVNNKMWHIAIDSDGNLGTVSQVSGLENVFSDGMTLANDKTFYYAENDALNPDNVGKVWKVDLISSTSAKASLETGVSNNGLLNNPSGLYYSKINKKNYLFVNESQLLNEKVTLPFKINIFQIQ